MADYERISITIEPELLARLDAHVQASGHANRSEAIRDMIRARLARSLGEGAPSAATLTVVYDHRQRALADHMVDAAHAHHALVLSTLHVHLDAHTCLEVTALKGARQELEHYASHILHMKGVLHGELVVVPCGEGHG